ncbi:MULTISPECIES: hypothetical protein [Empedobacter]|uniref:Tetratricopeptide repeat protein n=1 Tax=Empedobacter tilapiae TaxID=2491114 RepID=A0A4Z1BCS5_9FLAO|nr:hypothetical protein [Empedobacter tilapiae]TGN26404.1 hypothetical protein E4J94_11275 [Empedobacter tilapiae]
MEFNVTNALKQLNTDYSEDKASEIIENLLYNSTDFSDEDHEIIDELNDKFLRIAAQIFVEDLAYDFNTLVNYWEAFIGQLTEEQSQNLLNFAIEQTDVDFVEDFIIGYRKFYTNPKESITFFNKIDEHQFYEIKFFKARCYEVLNEEEKAVEAYVNYLNSDYFKLEENAEQAAVNTFYISHNIAPLLVKVKKYKEAKVYFDNVLKNINFEDYLANFEDSNQQEIKSFLENYVTTLQEIGEDTPANDFSKKIMQYFS